MSHVRQQSKYSAPHSDLGMQVVQGAIGTSPLFHIRGKERLEAHAWAFHWPPFGLTDVSSAHISLARTSLSFIGRGWETNGVFADTYYRYHIHYLAIGPWVSCLLSLCLSFSIC